MSDPANANTCAAAPDPPIPLRIQRRMLRQDTLTQSHQTAQEAQVTARASLDQARASLVLAKEVTEIVDAASRQLLTGTLHLADTARQMAGRVVQDQESGPPPPRPGAAEVLVELIRAGKDLGAEALRGRGHELVDRLMRLLPAAQDPVPAQEGSSAQEAPAQEAAPAQGAGSAAPPAPPQDLAAFGDLLARLTPEERAEIIEALQDPERIAEFIGRIRGDQCS